MKHLILTALLSGLLIGCGGSEIERKKAQLAELKNDQLALREQIEKLEAEINVLETGSPDGSGSKIKATPLELQTFNHYVSIPGNVEMDNNIVISAEFGGRVSRIHVKEGDEVKKGQLLAELDAAVFDQSIKELKSALEISATAFDKQKKLHEKGIGSDLQLTSAREAKESLEKKLQFLETQLEQTRFTSPIDGTIDELKVKEGLNIGSGSPMLRIVNRSGIKVTARITDTHLAFIKKGDQVIVHAPDLNKEIPGEVSFVSSTIDPSDRTFKVVVIPQDAEQRLRPEVHVNVRFSDENRENAIVIDEKLVQELETGKTVFVAIPENGKKVARKRLVKTGLSYDGKVEIIDGLRPGELLITGAEGDIEEGQIVE